MKIQAKVSDDVSGTKNARFMFTAPSDPSKIFAFLYVEEYDALSKTYTFESKELSHYAENGDWELSMITVRDYAGDEKTNISIGKSS